MGKSKQMFYITPIYIVQGFKQMKNSSRGLQYMQGGREVKGYKVVKNTAIIREEKKKQNTSYNISRYSQINYE